jgi:hypothetical protein
MLPTVRIALAAAVVLLVSATCRGDNRLLRIELPGQTVEGRALAFDDTKVFLLTRGGQLARVDPRKVSSFQELPGGFRSYSLAEMRGQLIREFGAGFEVSGAGSYIVVHPVGKRDVWAPRFDELYRSFVHYFSARGWQLDEPPFPLVAVVYPRQADFQREAAREGLTSSSVLGYYSPRTNRILMYDAAERGDWSQNAETIIHEAAHQAAFNAGVHSRFGDSPRWVVEGLGTMFEARGVWQSRAYPQVADRVNRGQLAAYRSYASRRPQDALARLVSSDRLFSDDDAGAYAEAWALSFYLCENEPRKYFEYLGRTAGRPPFDDYKSPQRLADFVEIFGSDLVMLDARMQRFLVGLR